MSETIEGQKLVLESMKANCTGIQAAPADSIRSVGGEINRTEDKLIRYSDEAWRLNILIDREIAKIRFAESIIKTMPDTRLATIIRGRYIAMDSWGKIASACRIKKTSLRKRYIYMALDAFDVAYNKYKIGHDTQK